MITPVKDWMKKKFTDWLTEDRRANLAPLFDFHQVAAELRPGDVVLVEGLSRVSTIIKHITHSPWTHSTLYLGCLQDIKDPQLREKLAEHWQGDPDEPLLIESLLGEGTIAAPLTKYRNNHLRICRPIGLSRAELQQVVAYVINRLGTDYDIAELMECAWLLMGENLRPTGWRARLFQAKVKRLEGALCSSMLGQAFMSVRFPVLPVVQQTPEGQQRISLRTFRMLAPRDFDRSPSFEVVKIPVDAELRQTLIQMTVMDDDPEPRWVEAKIAPKPKDWGWGLGQLFRRIKKNRRQATTSISRLDTGPPD